MSVKKGLLVGLSAGAIASLILIVGAILYPGTSPSDETDYLIATLLGIAGWPLSTWPPVAYIGFLIGRSLPVLVNFSLAGVLVAVVFRFVRRAGRTESKISS